MHDIAITNGLLQPLVGAALAELALQPLSLQ